MNRSGLTQPRRTRRFGVDLLALIGRTHRAYSRSNSGVRVSNRRDGTGERALRLVPAHFREPAPHRSESRCWARKLTPPEFGVVALAQMAVSLLTVFGSGGIITYIVCDRDADWEDRVHPAFWLNVTMATASCIFALVCLPLVQWLYHQPLIGQVLLVILADYFIDQLKMVPEALLQRQLKFRMLAIRDTARDFLTAGLAVAMAIGWSRRVEPRIAEPTGRATRKAHIHGSGQPGFSPRLVLGRAASGRGSSGSHAYGNGRTIALGSSATKKIPPSWVSVMGNAIVGALQSRPTSSANSDWQGTSPPCSPA